MTKDRATADAIMDRLRVKAADADIATLERLASAFKIVREGMAYTPQEPTSKIILLPDERSSK
jgi:hypothetical protein